MTLRTLDGYLARATLLPFAGGLTLFVVVTAFAEVLTFTDTTTGLGIGVADMAALVLFSLPPLLGLLLPISGLYATLLAVGAMAQNRELLALAQMGYSPWPLLRVPAVLGVTLAALSAWALMVGEPWGIRCIRQKMAEGTTRALIDSVRPGLFYDWADGLTFWARGVDRQGFTAVMLADHRHRDNPTVISAARGTLTVGSAPQELWIELESGTVLQEGQKQDSSQVLHFDRGMWRIDVGALVRQKLRRVSDSQELSMAMLRQESHRKDLSLDARVLRAFMWHRKLAVPVAAIIFTVMAVPIGVAARHGHRVGGIVLSTLALAGYYHLGRFLELSARSGRFSGALAAWLPDGVALLMCAAMVAHMGRRRA